MGYKKFNSPSTSLRLFMKTSHISDCVNFRHYIPFTLLWGDIEDLTYLYAFRQIEKYFELPKKSNTSKSVKIVTYRHSKETTLKEVEIPNNLCHVLRNP